MMGRFMVFLRFVYSTDCNRSCGSRAAGYAARLHMGRVWEGLVLEYDWSGLKARRTARAKVALYVIWAFVTIAIPLAILLAIDASEAACLLNQLSESACRWSDFGHGRWKGWILRWSCV